MLRKRVERGHRLTASRRSVTGAVVLESTRPRGGRGRREREREEEGNGNERFQGDDAGSGTVSKRLPGWRVQSWLILVCRQVERIWPRVAARVVEGNVMYRE